MLLKLIPPHSEPTIHFSFAFTDLPTNVNSPSSWSGQLSHLVMEDLEVPTTIHSFDKAAGLTSLLEEVAFDIERGEVRCRFVDGGIEEWAFFRFGGLEADDRNGFEAGHREGQKLMRALHSIIRDVKESTSEDERAVCEREKERQRIAGLERSKSMTFRNASKPSKHRKQRSMFMQIVSSISSSIANLASSSSGPPLPSHRFSASLSTSSSFPAHLPSSAPKIPPPHLPGTSPRARALRRAARSALVDTFRRFVLTELTHRLPAFSYKDASGHYTGVHGGGFCVWILHSMRRRAQERIEQLLEEAEAVMVERARDRGIQLPPLVIPGNKAVQWAPEPGRPSEDAFEATTMAVPLSFSDDEDETETVTDGSSVHTPSSGSHLAYFPPRPPTSTSSHSQGSMSCQAYTTKELEAPPMTPTSPSPPSPSTPTSFYSDDLTPTRPAIHSRPTTLSQNLAGSALYEYTTLTELRERLWQLAMFAESQARITSDEIRNRLEILAVRSRRRAWSSGALKSCPDQTSGMGQYGLGMPFQSSPLARYSWTADDLVRDQEKMGRNGLVVSTTVSVTSFPVFDTPENKFECDTASLPDVDNCLHDERHLEYDEFPGPSPLDTRGGSRRRRNHVRGKDPVEFGIAPTPGLGRLFPVNEELESQGEEAVDMEFRVALGGTSRYGAMRGRRKGNMPPFIGCDEDVAGDDEQRPTIQRFQNPDALLDDDDGFEDPRDLDVELGFGGFDFHQHGTATDFIIHGNDDRLFDEDDDDEDDYKFDMSASLERPKIRPRVRTSSIFVRKEVTCQPINFAASTSPPKYPTLSKSAPSTFPPRRSRSPPIAISPPRAEKMRPRPAVSRPGLDIDVKAARAYQGTDFGRIGHLNGSTFDLKSPTKPLPFIPVQESDVREDVEFTLAMDLPRSMGGQRNPTNQESKQKKPKLSSSHSVLHHSRPTLSSIFEDVPVPIVS